MGVKTAISLPDALFERAERVAARLELSRSELYARALASYLREHEGEEITRSIDRCLEAAAVRPDVALRRLGTASLGPDEGPLEDWVDSRKRPSRRGRRRRG